MTVVYSYVRVDFLRTTNHTWLRFTYKAESVHQVDNVSSIFVYEATAAG
jgi:hypothetical protein